MAAVSDGKLLEVALRIREMREIAGISTEEMAKKTEVSVEQYIEYEKGKLDFPFSFIHKCALSFGLGITDLLEGHSAHLSSYTVTRKGKGQKTAKEDGIDITNLAPKFRDKIAEPYFVRYTGISLYESVYHNVKQFLNGGECCDQAYNYGGVF